MVVQETLGRSHFLLTLTLLVLLALCELDYGIGKLWSWNWLKMLLCVVSNKNVAGFGLGLEADDREVWIRFLMWDKIVEALIGAT